MAHPDCEGAKVCSAPWHRRLRERADADCTADTPSTVLPRSRRDSAGAADPVGSLSSDQTEVLHHCGRSDHRSLSRPLLLYRYDLVFEDPGPQPFLDQPEDALIADPMFEEADDPFLGNFREERPDISVQYETHLLAADS